MTNTPASDDEDPDLQGAIDWAHSIQLRQAEKLMGWLARSSGDTEMDPAYRAKLLQVIEEAGFGEVASRFPIGAKLRKVTELDEPEVRIASQNSVDSLVKTMEAAGMATGGRRLLIWSLASGQVNALCAANSWDEKHYHIFVDADLMVFCNSIAKLYAECLTHRNMKGGEIDLHGPGIIRNARSETIQLRAADLFGSAVLKGSTRASEPWPPSPEALPLVIILGNMLMMFPVAHELGHLHLGHLEAEETHAVAVAGFENLAAQVYSNEAEFQADTVGAIISSQTAIRLEISSILTVLAPYIFLKSVETLDACHAVFEGNPGDMSFTHPSPTERARRMREVIAMHMQFHNSGALLPIALRRVDQVSHWLMFSAITNLKRLKAKGTKPRERIRLRMSELDAKPTILGLVPIAQA